MSSVSCYSVQRSRQKCYLLREHMCSEISKCELETTVLAVDQDLDGNQGIGTDGPRMWVAHVRDVNVMKRR